MTTLYIALALVALVLLFWLIALRRRSHRLVEQFCERRGLIFCEQDDGSLQRAIDYAFELSAPANRRFFDIRDIATDGNVTLFRLSEALVLDGENREHDAPVPRIAATFSAPVETDVFLLYSRRLKMKNLHPDGRIPEEDPHFPTLQETIAERPLPYALSVTLARGRGLIYLVPRQAQALTDGDLEFLFGTAKRIERAFTGIDPIAALRRADRP